MRIERLVIGYNKRIRELIFDFPRPLNPGKHNERTPWTVIIGENGTCKTTILQGIALAAAGREQLNILAGPLSQDAAGLGAMRLRAVAQGTTEKVTINPCGTIAYFRLSDAEQRPALLQLDKILSGSTHGNAKVEQCQYLISTVMYAPRMSQISGFSFCTDSLTSRPSWMTRLRNPMDIDAEMDPLALIRREGNPSGFFVAAYGTTRPLPSPEHVPARLTALDRLRPLFADTPKLTSVAFYRMFAETDPERAEVFRQAVNSVLHPPGGKPLMPGLSELRYNPPRRNELMERQTVRQRMGEGFVDIPTLTLALGHQSTLAWIADLIGHAMLADDNITTTQQITGIALVDEIDLYVHPSLQVSLIRNLMRAFPRVQFIVTTHSPLVLAALRPDQDEIVRLEIDPNTGLVVRKDMKQGQPHEPDARVMSMAGVYKHYFGVDSAYAGPEGAMLYRHQALANDPTRSDAEDAELQDLRAKLTEAGVGGLLEPIARDPS